MFGYIALRQIRQSSGAQEGRGLVVVGVVLGWLGAAALGLVLIVAVAVANEADDSNDAFAEADTTDESGLVDDAFTGDGIPPEELEPAQLADCHLMRDYQNRPVVVASTVSGRPAVNDFEVEYVDGHTETFTVEYPDYAGTSIFVNGSQACSVTAVRSAEMPTIMVWPRRRRGPGRGGGHLTHAQHDRQAVGLAPRAGQ